MIDELPRSPGTVCTFYSFKGGVGRSMALANVAALLARWGQRVLVLDWDLEAPGIEKFFQRWLRGDRKHQDGLVELVRSGVDGEPGDWRACTLTVALPQSEPISVLHAGRDDAGYVERLRLIDWEHLFREHRFGLFLESLRNEWIREFDFVLVDSRTGITDIGGICSIFLPDILLTFFTANEQSLIGVRDVMTRARKGHEKLPVDRRRLLLVPVPSRDESNSEYQLAAEWRKRFATELHDFFRDWIPREETPERVLNHLKIPYFPFWSFGERLPVVEEDADNPKTLAFSYQLLARLLLGKLDWQEVREGTRSAEAEVAQQAQVEEKRLAVQTARATAQREADERRRTEELARAAERDKRYARYAAERIEPQLAKLDRSIRLSSALMLTFVALFLCVLLFAAALVVAPALIETRSGLPAPLLWTLIFMTAAPVLAGLWFAHEMRLRHRRLRQQLRAEAALYDGRAGPYDDLMPEAALKRFIERAEHVIAVGGKVLDNEASRQRRIATTVPSVFEAGVAATEHQTGRDPLEHVSESTSTVLQTSGHEPAEVAARYDIYLSYRSSSLVDGWLEEFLPLLRAWVEESIGRKVTIFYDKNVVEGADWRAASEQALSTATCFVAVITPAYFTSKLNLIEWHAFQARSPDAMFPVVLHPVDFPDLPAPVQYLDLSPYAYVGEGFARSDLYVEFQDHVRRLATAIADRLAAEVEAADSPA